MVSRAVPAPLSNVLGGAFGLSPFALRRAAGTSGRSHHPEPPRSTLHRYSDEFHVPQRGVVVLLHADPVLFDFSHPVPGCASFRTVVVPVNRMCCRIFCALYAAYSLASKWLVGAGWFRYLPFARVRAGNLTCNVAHPIDGARGMV